MRHESRHLQAESDSRSYGSQSQDGRGAADQGHNDGRLQRRFQVKIQYNTKQYNGVDHNR